MSRNYSEHFEYFFIIPLDSIYVISKILLLKIYITKLIDTNKI